MTSFKIYLTIMFIIFENVHTLRMTCKEKLNEHPVITGWTSKTLWIKAGQMAQSDIEQLKEPLSDYLLFLHRTEEPLSDYLLFLHRTEVFEESKTRSVTDWCNEMGPPECKDKLHENKLIVGWITPVIWKAARRLTEEKLQEITVCQYSVLCQLKIIETIMSIPDYKKLEDEKLQQMIKDDIQDERQKSKIRQDKYLKKIELDGVRRIEVNEGEKYEKNKKVYVETKKESDSKTEKAKGNSWKSSLINVKNKITNNDPERIDADAENKQLIGYEERKHTIVLLKRYLKFLRGFDVYDENKMTIGAYCDAYSEWSEEAIDEPKTCLEIMKESDVSAIRMINFPTGINVWKVAKQMTEKEIKLKNDVIQRYLGFVRLHEKCDKLKVDEVILVKMSSYSWCTKVDRLCLEDLRLGGFKNEKYSTDPEATTKENVLFAKNLEYVPDYGYTADYVDHLRSDNDPKKVEPWCIDHCVGKKRSVTESIGCFQNTWTGGIDTGGIDAILVESIGNMKENEYDSESNIFKRTHSFIKRERKPKRLAGCARYFKKIYGLSFMGTFQCSKATEFCEKDCI